MSDTAVLYEKCIHGRLESHPNISYGDEPVEDNCPGGRERTFEYLEECCTRCGNDCFDHSVGVWKEVTDE